MQETIHESGRALDYALGTGGLTAPFWIPKVLQDGLWVYAVICGIVLITLRVMIAWREWRRGI